MSGGVGLLDGDPSDSACPWWARGGCGGGWLGEWRRLSLLAFRRGVKCGWCGEPGVWVVKGLACLGGAGACFLVPSHANHSSYRCSSEQSEERLGQCTACLTSAIHVRTRPLGSWGSDCEMSAAVPLRRRGGHELAGWAVKIQQISPSTYRRVIRAGPAARRAMRRCEKSC